MGKVVNFTSREKLTQTDIDHIIQELQELDPKKVKSIFVNITVEGEEGLGTYTVTKNLDFFDYGFIQSYLQALGSDYMEGYIVDTAPIEEVSEYSQQFKKPPEEDGDE